jgi:hypothetical protein
LLLFALVLGLTAIAASVVPPPADEERSSSAPSTSTSTTTTTTTADEASPGEQRAGFRFPAPEHKPVTRRVDADSPLAVVVASTGAGQATIPRLGRVASVTPEDPARFDVLPEPGRYDVHFTPVTGKARLVGRLVVESQR